MKQNVITPEFEIRTAEYFAEKAAKVSGPNKLLVALEKSKFISSALQHGLSFNDLKRLGFKFATV
jgi:hypothetical protein